MHADGKKGPVSNDAEANKHNSEGKSLARTSVMISTKEIDTVKKSTAKSRVRVNNESPRLAIVGYLAASCWLSLLGRLNALRLVFTDLASKLVRASQVTQVFTN